MMFSIKSSENISPDKRYMYPDNSWKMWLLLDYRPSNRIMNPVLDLLSKPAFS